MLIIAQIMLTLSSMFAAAKYTQIHAGLFGAALQLQFTKSRMKDGLVKGFSSVFNNEQKDSSLQHG